MSTSSPANPSQKSPSNSRSSLGEGAYDGVGGRVATKTENSVRTPMCPNKEHGDEKIRLVSGGDNELLKCPKCKNIYDINGNKKGELQPEWESKEIN